MSNITQQTALLIEGLKTVGVQFYNGSTKDYKSDTYAYKTLENLQIGDLCVVDGAGHKKVVKVVELHMFPKLEQATKWVMDKVDTAKYERILEMEEILQGKLQQIQTKKFREQAIEALLENSGMTQEELTQLTTESSKFLLEVKA